MKNEIIKNRKDGNHSLVLKSCTRLKYILKSTPSYPILLYNSGFELVGL